MPIMKNKIVAHRGWSGRAPENTMAAFDLALQAPFVSGVELDVQLSKDGVPIVIHDYTLERTTTGKGFVRNHTFEQLSRLDAGRWYSAAYAGEKIPTLAEALSAMKGRGIVNIEIKTIGNMYPGIAKAVVQTIRNAGLERNAVLTSFDHAVMKQAKKIDPDIRTGLLYSKKPKNLKEEFQRTGAALLSIAYTELTKALTAEAFDLGFGIMAWTVDQPANIREVAALHPDLWICTNHPDRAAAALQGDIG